MAYDVDLFCKLYEIFPDSFSDVKTVTLYDVENGPFGQEQVISRTEEVTLGGYILDTAKAISREGREMNRAIRFLEAFRSKKVQTAQIERFKNHSF